MSNYPEFFAIQKPTWPAPMPQAWGVSSQGQSFCTESEIGDTTAPTCSAMCSLPQEMGHKGNPTKCPSCEEMLVLILRWQKSIMHKANPQETWAPFVPALKELMVVCFKYVLFPYNSS